jgi:sec-independent protein translocase protein TatC
MTTPGKDPEDELAGTEAPFVSHLVELRDRMIRGADRHRHRLRLLALWPGMGRCTTCWRSRWWRTCPKAPS